jgi:ribosomal protein L37AE/L43A
MAKGYRCPSCGELTMQRDGGVHKCSSCGCVGWWKQPGSAGKGGKGFTCKSCGTHQLHTVFEGKFAIRHCTNGECGAVVIS